MNNMSVIDMLILAAFTARQGGGGKMEAEALVALTAMKDAQGGTFFARLSAARLVGSWCRKYEFVMVNK